MKEALSLWEERERTRAELYAAIDEAETSLARDEGRAALALPLNTARPGK